MGWRSPLGCTTTLHFFPKQFWPILYWNHVHFIHNQWCGLHDESEGTTSRPWISMHGQWQENFLPFWINRSVLNWFSYIPLMVQYWTMTASMLKSGPCRLVQHHYELFRLIKVESQGLIAAKYLWFKVLITYSDLNSPCFSQGCHVK